jgi:C_GCAxxG_C_C family probable redox protein
VASQVERASQRAYEVFLRKQVLGCSQAVMLGIQETFGPRDPLLLKAVGILAGGSRAGSLCGALQGGLLALGMYFGPPEDKMGDLEALAQSFIPAKRLYAEFTGRFGSRLCRDITRADLDVPHQRQAWLDRGGWEECARLVRETTGIVASLIVEK